MRSHITLPFLAGAILVQLAVAACGGDSDEIKPVTRVISPTTVVTEAQSRPEPVPTETTDTIASRVDPKSVVPEASGLLAPYTGNEPPAPELADTGRWINSEPFTLESQRGKVVMVDFWTYTCINCIRTLPYMRSWQSKYAEHGLVILGVHTPEFEFEKLYDNVVDASQKFDLRYPIVQDNDFGTWRAFSNRFWPAKYIVGKNGRIRYTHFGEGAYQETELVIRELLEEAGTDLADVSADAAPQPEFDSRSRSGDPMTSLTREIYAGYERNYRALSSNGETPPYVLHPEYYQEVDADVLYVDPGSHQNHFLYLSGLWRNEAERLVHARSTESYEDYVSVKFFATSVNAVMAPVDAGTLDMRITVDGRPLTEDEAGFDVMFDDAGNSFVVVDDDRMYSLINKEMFGTHELMLSSNSDQFSLFAFTFGSYVGGERES